MIGSYTLNLKEEVDMNIKLFTHNDLDGIGCGILAILAFDDVDIEYCTYGDINGKVSEFLKENKYNNYDHIYITDISISLDLAKEIDKMQEKFTLIDHHPTALDLNNFSWCTVEVENKNGKNSGINLFHSYLKNKKLNKQNVIEFVEIVRQYDTWEWATIYDNDIPKKWNDLLYIYGTEKFVAKIVKKLKNKDTFVFTQTDLLLLELEEDKKKQYIKKKTKELIEKNIKGYHVGIVFAEQYISELGNYLAKNNSQLDFIILIGNKTISYRGIKDIDLGKFAKQFGGGGHPRASGSQICIEKQIEYIEKLFK